MRIKYINCNYCCLKDGFPEKARKHCFKMLFDATTYSPRMRNIKMAQMYVGLYGATPNEDDWRGKNGVIHNIWMMINPYMKTKKKTILEMILKIQSCITRGEQYEGINIGKKLPE